MQFITRNISETSLSILLHKKQRKGRFANDFHRKVGSAVLVFEMHQLVMKPALPSVNIAPPPFPLDLKAAVASSTAPCPTSMHALPLPFNTAITTTKSIPIPSTPPLTISTGNKLPRLGKLTAATRKKKRLVQGLADLRQRRAQIQQEIQLRSYGIQQCQIGRKIIENLGNIYALTCCYVRNGSEVRSDGRFR